MKKLITVVALIAGLAVSSNARVVDNVSKSDFKYVFDFSTKKCALTQVGILDFVYKNVENRTANFVKVGIGGLTYNVFGMRQNGKDVSLFFFDSFKGCQGLQNADKSAQHAMRNIADYTHLVAEECSTKTDWETTTKIMGYNEKGYSIKESVEKLGLNCNK